MAKAINTIFIIINQHNQTVVLDLFFLEMEDAYDYIEKNSLEPTSHTVREMQKA